MHKVFLQSIGVGSLVVPRPIFESVIGKVLYVTISPNAKTSHETERSYRVDKTLTTKKRLKVMYQEMTHREQANYLRYYLEHVYCPVLDPEDRAVIIHELNESNNLHYHMLLYCPSIQTEYDLQAFRKTIAVHPFTIRNRHKGSIMDYMNNIVYADHPLKTFDEYFTKQEKTGIKKVFGDLVINIQ